MSLKYSIVLSTDDRILAVNVPNFNSGQSVLSPRSISSSASCFHQGPLEPKPVKSASSDLERNVGAALSPLTTKCYCVVFSSSLCCTTKAGVAQQKHTINSWSHGRGWRGRRGRRWWRVPDPWANVSSRPDGGECGDSFHFGKPTSRASTNQPSPVSGVKKSPAVGAQRKKSFHAAIRSHTLSLHPWTIMGFV